MTSSPVAGVHVEPAVLRAATIAHLMTHVPDPRHRRGRRHSLTAVLVIAVGAVTAGARSLTGIAEWAHDVGADLLDLVGLAGTVPSEATIRRIIETLDAGMFSLLCGAWTRLRWRQIDGQGVLAIDGKTVRRARNAGQAAPHLVAALTHDTGLVLGQIAVDTKSNEIPAIRDLLGLMDFSGLVITADAMHTQHDTAQFEIGFQNSGHGEFIHARLGWPLTL